MKIGIYKCILKMKKYKILLFISFIIFASACNNESEIFSYTELETVSLYAHSDGENTRTLIQDDFLVVWEPGDEIKLFNNQVGSRFVSQNTEPCGSAVFSGLLSTTLISNEGFSLSNPLWGLYPYSDFASSDGNSVNTTIPSHQAAPENSFDRTAYVTIGKSSSMSMWFHAVCGGMCFTFSRDDITSIVIKGNNNEPLSGDVSIVMPESEPSISKISHSSNEITLLPKNQGVFKSGEKYYAVMLPVCFKNGFTMTIHTADGKEGSYISQYENTIKRSVFADIINADTYVPEWKESQDSPYSDMGNGVYLGICAFNQTLFTSPIQRLTSSSVADYNSFIDALSSNNGTLLYYAADYSLNSLQKSVLPGNVSNIFLVTFTDGLDQGSIMMNPKYSSDEEYLLAINKRIKNETILDKPITAYAVGVRGNDVTNLEMFKKNLKLLSNPEENYSEISYINQLNSKFSEIAERITSISSGFSLALTIPGQANGTRIRFTFDDVSKAEDSRIYIEGTFNLQECSLNNINYCGISSESGTDINGLVNGIFVSFSFADVCINNGTSFSKENIKQWNYIQSSSSWQINSEFDNGDAIINRQPIVVLLNLDCSKSLGNSIMTMQSSAKQFIASLLSNTLIPEKANSISLNRKDDVLGVGRKHQLIATVEPITATNKNVIWYSTNKSIVEVDNCGNVFGVGEGDATIIVKTVDGGYTSSCQISVVDYSHMPANSHVVRPNQIKSIKAVKGNTLDPVGSVKSVDVLWESLGTNAKTNKGDIVESVSYNNGEITIRTGNNCGNAVIAAKNENGVILWSWHVWVILDDLYSLAHEYYNNAGIVMDRNLGAGSAVPGDVKSLGLLYQWGRKDPFLCASSICGNEFAQYYGPNFTYENQSSITTTEEYLIQHPMTYISYSSSYHEDWDSNGKSTLWNINKGIQDPCPAGWKVSNDDVWEKALGQNQSNVLNRWDPTNRGADFGGIMGPSQTIWYPAAGNLNIFGILLENCGNSGEYWGCQHNNVLRINMQDGGLPSAIYGLSVRCVAE